MSCNLTGGEVQSSYGSFPSRAGFFCVFSDVVWIFLVNCVIVKTNNILFTLNVYSPNWMNRSSSCYMDAICRLNISLVYCSRSALLINFCGFSLVLVYNVPTNYASNASKVSLSLDLRVPFIFCSYFFTAPHMIVCGNEACRVSCVSQMSLKIRSML
jgi:hypothetical protein